MKSERAGLIFQVPKAFWPQVGVLSSTNHRAIAIVRMAVTMRVEKRENKYERG